MYQGEDVGIRRFDESWYKYVDGEMRYSKGKRGRGLYYTCLVVTLYDLVPMQSHRTIEIQKKGI